MGRPGRAQGAPVAPAEPVVRAPGRRIAPEHVVDVFVYVVVLNLATQYTQVVTESFSTSLVLAVVLKLVLEVVLHAKTWARGRFRAARTPVGRVVGLLTLLVILPGSKLLVLWVAELLFGDAVHLGSFVGVTLLIVVLLLSRLAVRRLLDPDAAARRTPRHPPAPSA